MSLHIPTESVAGRWRSGLSLAMLTLSGAALAATYFLISPRGDQTFPGAIPWAAGSWLRPLVEGMGLFGLAHSERGVEIKDLAFHVAVGLGLLLFAGRAWISGVAPPDRESARGAWFLAQVCLTLWVLFSVASALWSRAPALSLGQGALYGFGIAWAISLAWTLEGRDVPRLLAVYVVIAAAGAALCAWYTFERNPFHRPGFPIGNPSPLATVTLPALIICGFVALGGLADRWRGRASGSPGLILGAAAALVPLVLCFHLAASRGAQVGAVLGLLGVAMVTTTRRVRGLVAVIALLAAGIGSWALSTSMQDVTMSRGATLRFRAYAWRYAAELWGLRPVSGMGAGQYPRLASELAGRDEALDPAAFLGDVVEHAHNELFEVLSEIGLIGGVTFVAGYVATIVAASALLQTSFSSQRRWLVYGLVASVLAVLGDALFGVGFRLPGVPVVFFTLLGALWSLGRASSLVRARSGAETIVDASRLRNRYAIALAAGTCGLAALALGWRNWQGVQAELRGVLRLEAGDYPAARAEAEAAADLLLDPVRQLMNRTRIMRAQWHHGRELYEAATRLKESDPGRTAARQAAAVALRDAFALAITFDRFAPRFDRSPMLAAQAAILMASLAQPSDAAAAEMWRNEALTAWQRQRMQRPYDRTTLLTLAHFPMLLGERLGLLRDALRTGLTDRHWFNMFRDTLRYPQAGDLIEAFAAAAGPYTPETEIDALIMSGAPESYRMRGTARFIAGDLEGAIADALHAAELYRAMRTRFPDLMAVALYEAAEYQVWRNPGDFEPAIASLQAALRSLPVIQRQQYDVLAAPFRRTLAQLLLAADRRVEAEEMLRVLFPYDEGARRSYRLNTYVRLMTDFLRRPGRPMEPVDRWFRRAVEIEPSQPLVWISRMWMGARLGPAAFAAAQEEALSAGMDESFVEAVRAGLCRAMRGLCGEEDSGDSVAPEADGS